MDIINNIYLTNFLFVFGFLIASLIDFYSSKLRLDSYLKKKIASGIYKSDFLYYSRRIFIFFIPPIIGYLSVIKDQESFFIYQSQILFFISLVTSVTSLFFIYYFYKKYTKKNLKIAFSFKIIFFSTISLIILYYSPFFINSMSIKFPRYSPVILQLYPIIYLIPAVYISYFYKISLGKIMDKRNTDLVVKYLFSYKISIFFKSFSILLFLIFSRFFLNT